MKRLSRKCLCCGRRLKISVADDRSYSGGHYFGKIGIPVKGTGTCKKLGSTKFGKMKVGIVKWTGKEKRVEYWECNKCASE